MSEQEHGQLLAGVKVTSLGTLASRLLGMFRDMAMASLFGLETGGVMDAFALAFRVPNLARRLFGEGALTASFLPVFTRTLERDRRLAWQLASVLLWRLGLGLGLLLAVAEVVCGLLWLAVGDRAGWPLLLGLTAVMLPYLLPICLAAQTAAMLNAFGRFGRTAWAPTLLNILWLAAAFLAPWMTSDKITQAYLIATAVAASGFLQWSWQAVALREFGYRFDYRPLAVAAEIRDVWRSMHPMLLGLAVTQLNTFADSLLAYFLAAPLGSTALLFGRWTYPMTSGANAAVYYGERLYQFPLGIVGLAVATVIYPLLSRHAARGDGRQLGADLTLGLRLVLAIGIPSSAGLVCLASPIASLLFQRGQFTPEDALRTARMIACYSSGVWAFCALSVLVRGFYALGDHVTPVRVGVGMVLFNLVLNVLLIWPLAEAGLALATSLAAMLQVGLLLKALSRLRIPLHWRSLGRTLLQTAASTLAMSLVVVGVLHLLASYSLTSRLLQVGLPALLGSVTFFAVSWLLGQEEIRWLLRRSPRS